MAIRVDEDEDEGVGGSESWERRGECARRGAASIVSITDNNKLFVRVWHAADSVRPTISTV